MSTIGKILKETPALEKCAVSVLGGGYKNESVIVTIENSPGCMLNINYSIEKEKSSSKGNYLIKHKTWAKLLKYVHTKHKL